MLHRVQPLRAPLLNNPSKGPCDRRATPTIPTGHSLSLAVLHQSMIRLQGILPSSTLHRLTSLPSITLQRLTTQLSIILRRLTTQRSRLHRLTAQSQTSESRARKRKKSVCGMVMAGKASLEPLRLLLRSVQLHLCRSPTKEMFSPRAKILVRLRMVINRQLLRAL